MEGARFIVNAQGKKAEVLISLKKHGALWQDVYDQLLAEKRKQEPRETLASVRARLKRQGKLNG